MPLEAGNMGMLTAQKKMPKEIQRVTKMVTVADGMFLLSVMP